MKKWIKTGFLLVTTALNAASNLPQPQPSEGAPNLGPALSEREELVAIIECWAAVQNTFILTGRVANAPGFKMHGNSAFSFQQNTGPKYSISENEKEIRVETMEDKNKVSTVLRTDCEIKSALLNIYRDLAYVGANFKVTEKDMPEVCKKHKLIADTFFKIDSYLRGSSPSEIRALAPHKK